jgi:hypothetical protein
VKIGLLEVRVAKNGGFSDVELGRILPIMSENRSLLLEAWNDFFA